MPEWSAAPLVTAGLASKHFSPLKQWLMKQKVFKCVISLEPVEIILICSTTQSTVPSSLALIGSVVQNATSKSVDSSPVCRFFSFHLEVFRLWGKDDASGSAPAHPKPEGSAEATATHTCTHTQAPDHRSHCGCFLPINCQYR